jgi:hypothetical protein
LVVVAALGAGCAPVAPPQVGLTSYPFYQYTIAPPTEPVAPNEQLHLVWEPHLASDRQSAIADLQLCIALFGPWDTVEALKTAMSNGVRPSCPPSGAVVASDPVRTTSASGARFTTDLLVPSAAGFYDLHQFSITSGGSTSAGGIIEVRKR